MINIREILSSLYADRSAEQLYAWLEDQDLLESFKRVVSQLNAIIREEHNLMKTCQSLPVGHIAANLLVAVNKHIAAEGSPVKAKELENTLGDICLQVLLSFLNAIRSDKATVWMQINYALKDTCAFHNYDFNQLIRFLKIDAATSYLQSHKSADHIVMTAPVPSLRWKGDLKYLNDFLDVFIDQRLVKSKKGLARLFDNPVQSLELQFSRALADLTIQFFYTVKKRKLATHSNCSGFYQALEFHLVDFKKDFLKNQDAGRRINTLRQSLVKWDDNQRRIDGWLQSFMVPKTGDQTVLQT